MNSKVSPDPAYPPPPAYGSPNHPPPAYGVYGGASGNSYGTQLSGGFSYNNTMVVTNQPTAPTVIVQREPKPDNYLIISIIVAAGCNIVFGLIAVFCALQSDSAYNRGDVAEAHQRGRYAFKLSIAGIFCTVVGVIIVIIIYMVFIVSLLSPVANAYR